MRIDDFFCVGVMYSGEYDVCDVTLSVYPHRAGRKVSLTTVGIRCQKWRIFVIVRKAIIDKFCSLFCTSPFCTSEILIDEFVSRVVALKINKKQHTINVNRI